MNYLSIRRFWQLSCVLLCVSVLTQCVAPALLLAPQGQLMWALLKPMVGLDPKEANLFKQPLIQSRLEPLLGSHYTGAVQLLETADKIQQEGPLFYVVSKYTPVPELAEKAGFVWNSETNQMAVLLVSGGAPQVFAEKLNEEVSAQIPVWPKELSDYTDPAKLRQQAIDKAKQQLSDKIPVPTEVAPLVNTVTDLKDIKGQTKALIENKQQSLVDAALSPLTDAKQQAQQQIQQVKDQSTSAVLTPVTDAKQQAKQQIQQIKDQSTSSVLTPVTDAKQQAKQQVQQIKDQSTSAVLTPVIETKQQAQEATKQLKTNIDIPQTQTAPNAELIADDDLAAELATEQQSLKTEKSQRVNLLQQQIKATEQQLQKATTADDRKRIELQLQQLRTTLALLKTTN